MPLACSTEKNVCVTRKRQNANPQESTINSLFNERVCSSFLSSSTYTLCTKNRVIIKTLLTWNVKQGCHTRLHPRFQPPSNQYPPCHNLQALSPLITTITPSLLHHLCEPSIPRSRTPFGTPTPMQPTTSATCGPGSNATCLPPTLRNYSDRCRPDARVYE